MALFVGLLIGSTSGNLQVPASRFALRVSRGGGRVSAIANPNTQVVDIGLATRIPSGGVAASAPSTTSTIARTIGNVFNSLSIVTVVLLFYYYFQVSKHPGCLPWSTSCDSKPFDPEWWKDGFCIRNQGKLFTSTHAFCLYIDLALTWLLKTLLTKHDVQIKQLGLQNEYLNPMILWSTIIHGIGHFTLSYLDYKGFPSDPTGPISPALYIVNFVVYFALFASLYLASSPKFEWLDPNDPNTLAKIRVVDAVAIVLAFLSALLMDTKPFLNIDTSFTAVQTLTITYAAMIQLFLYPKEQKGFAYASFAGIVTFALNIVGWVIALDCTLPKVFGFNIYRLFGHIWFDGYLGSSYIIFLLTALKFMKPPSPILAGAQRRAARVVQTKRK